MYVGSPQHSCITLTWMLTYLARLHPYQKQRVEDQQMINNSPTQSTPKFKGWEMHNPIQSLTMPPWPWFSTKQQTYTNTRRKSTQRVLSPESGESTSSNQCHSSNLPPSLGNAKPPDKGTRFETQSTSKLYNITTKVQPTSTTAIAIAQQSTNQPSSHQPSPSQWSNEQSHQLVCTQVTMLGTPAHQLQTLCYANDSPGHGQIHFELPLPHERSSHCWNLDDGIWKRLWWDVSRQ